MKVESFKQFGIKISNLTMSNLLFLFAIEVFLGLPLVVLAYLLVHKFTYALIELINLHIHSSKMAKKVLLPNCCNQNRQLFNRKL